MGFGVVVGAIDEGGHARPPRFRWILFFCAVGRVVHVFVRTFYFFARFFVVWGYEMFARWEPYRGRKDPVGMLTWTYCVRVVGGVRA